MPERPLDTDPLVTPVPREAVRAYRDRVRAAGGAPPEPHPVLAVLVVLMVVAGVVGFLLVASVSLGGLLPDGLAAPVLLLAVPVVVLALAIVPLIRTARSGGPWQRAARLDRFAAANDLTYTPYRAGTAERGLIFDRGSDRRTLDHVRFGPSWLRAAADVALYRYTVTTGSGKNRRSTTYRWTYVAIDLDRNLPHMVLDAEQNDSGLFGASNLPVSFANAQRMRLEGDFDRYFRLFAPAGYERDALYVFTPDLMALLIDHAGTGGDAGPALDVEIVDDRMYLYAKERMDLLSPAVWQRLAAIVRLVGAKALRQTTRYADDRVGERALDVVAPAGRRLKRGVPVAAVVVAVLLLVAWAAQAFGVFGALR